ncbi:LOW QUALITY PROTEIN: SID1 transmembrane family member 1 [Leptonychotes weddellii]|uniref:LOW QUALITY PROTEIN: SID1 transmembrane family member 1 n=1 Tax=Leptonychotes weddellii TaxID=9713 RepID=A0A7F8RAS1_LEPWE|nr:LOW QUALITY PROTEIN: SID1 transmembrane family member 1 [Leptonychotes weddellii]
MRGCPRIALLCALLPWLLHAAAPRRPAQPLPSRDRRDPARGSDFDRVYSGVVSLTTENIYSFNYTSQPGQVNAVRVYVNSSSENLDYPVLVVVRQQKGVLSWQVPLLFQGLYQRSYNYQEVSRTLCPSEATNETGPLEQLVIVDVTSMAPLGAQYKLLVTKITHFQLQTNVAFHFTASPSQPQYFLYKFPDDVDSVIIKVRSEMAYPCSVVSVQNITCPVHDLDHNVEFNGVYQSMTKKAAITLQKKDFPSKQFFVVFVIKPEDYACGGSFFIQEKENQTWNLHRTKNLKVTIVPSTKGSVDVNSILISLFIFFFFYFGFLLIVLVHCISIHINVLHRVANTTGNQDICYYNFLCAHPLGVLSAFNNIFSNLGYVLLGFLFLLIVLHRDILHHRALEAKDSFAMEYGIPKHFGVFYAMGIALIMEGVLSACYHVCPNYSNFQFDTSFMYMIAGLCMLKLYQTRHPDINASAYAAYASFAAVITLTVLGVVFGKNDVWFWVIFSAIHVLASLALSTQIYYMGRFKIDVSDSDLGIFRRASMVFYTDFVQQCGRPLYMVRACSGVPWPSPREPGNGRRGRLGADTQVP